MHHPLCILSSLQRWKSVRSLHVLRMRTFAYIIPSEADNLLSNLSTTIRTASAVQRRFAVGLPEPSRAHKVGLHIVATNISKKVNCVVL